MKKSIAVILCLLFCLSCMACSSEKTGIPAATSGPMPGDIVTMGVWNGEAIRWQIMEAKEDGTFVLMSVDGLDTVMFNENMLENVTWKTCSLRVWLNGNFYEKAFNEEEKGRIVTVRLSNPGNTAGGIKGCGDTEDRVYILSLEEVAQYYQVDAYASGSSETLICMPSATAVKNGVRSATASYVEYNQPKYTYTLREGACGWWLRTPGDLTDPSMRMFVTAVVNPTGNANPTGMPNSDSGVCVRPVICVRF